MSVVCLQVEVSATSWSLVQRSPTDCGVSCVIYKNNPREWGGKDPLGGYRAKNKNINAILDINHIELYDWKHKTK
jgi:hypothetical protein